MNFLYLILAFLSGVASTTQALVNTKLMFHLGSPILSSFINFVIGTLVLAIIYLFSVLNRTETIPSISHVAQTSWWMWSGGILGAFFVFIIIWVSPKIGFANVFSLIVAGQVILSVILDHSGILGTPIHQLNLSRFGGVCLLIIGVYLIETN